MLQKTLYTVAILSLALIAAGLGCDGDSMPTGGQLPTEDDPLFVLRIESEPQAIQGIHEDIDIIVEAADWRIDAFDIRIGYDASALSFQAAALGGCDDCGWEYFVYEFGSYDCDRSVFPGIIHAVGIAETAANPAHPDFDCLDSLAAPFVLMTLDFLITDDRTYECSWVPIKFLWCNCGDNSLVYTSSNSQLLQCVSRHVLDDDTEEAGARIDNDAVGFPTHKGVQSQCLYNLGSPLALKQTVDFINGGIDVICADSIDARWPIGDINLNNIAYQIADAVLFSNYFVYGLDVFTIHREIQIHNTDVNKDGTPLTVEDLAYLIRVIVGDAIPYTGLGPVSWSEQDLDTTGGLIEVAEPIGAMRMIVYGQVAPTFLSDQLNGQFAFDSTLFVTRVLLSSFDHNAMASGGLLQVEGSILRLDMCTYDGDRIDVQGWQNGYPAPVATWDSLSGDFEIRFAHDSFGVWEMQLHYEDGPDMEPAHGDYHPGVNFVRFGFMPGDYSISFSAGGPHLTFDFRTGG